MPTILFDIDGTLVNTGGAGKTALDLALAEAFGIAASHDVQISGRTDRGIARNLFQVHSIEESQENWQRFRSAYLRLLAQMLHQRQGRVLPGVTELLQRLSSRDDVALGLLTGNVREGARLKLEHYQLYHHFAFGGFGDEHYERNGVAQEALLASQAHVNGDHDRVGRQIWVIGDTPLDVSCARWIGAQVIAVATGTHPREELAAENPDVLLDDLSEVGRIAELLG